MSTKGYPAPLTWDRLLELAAQGHDHYDAALTSTRARQLVASVREHFASQPEAPKGQEAGRWMVGEDGLARKQSFPITESLTRRTYDLERDLAAANAKIAKLETQHDADIDAIARAVRHEDRANARADAAERTERSARESLKALAGVAAERDQLAARVKELERLRGLTLEQVDALTDNQCTPEERAVLEAIPAVIIEARNNRFTPSLRSALDELTNRAAKAKK
jgi:hypothetical protein